MSELEPISSFGSIQAWQPIGQQLGYLNLVPSYPNKLSHMWNNYDYLKREEIYDT
jgi:hypothetical protein